MRRAWLVGTWREPEIVVEDGPGLALPGAVRQPDGTWRATWSADPATDARKAGLSLAVSTRFAKPGRRPIKVNQAARPLVVAEGGRFYVYPRLTGFSLLTRILGPLHLDGAGRAVLGRTDVFRVAAFVVLDASAYGELLSTPVPSWFRLSLRPYQAQGAVQCATRRPYVADEPGLGKTRQLLAAAAFSDPGRVVIVCPPVVITSWAKEASASGLGDPEHAPVTTPVGSAHEVEVASHVCPIYAGRKEPDLPPSGVVIVADSLLASRPSLLKKIIAWAPQCLLVDELHRCKDGSTKRTKAVTRLSRHVGGPVYGASGTPMLATPYELVPQLKIVRRLAPVFGSRDAFVRTYLTKTPWGQLRPRMKALGDLHTKLASSVWVRRLKKDVLPDLPPKERRLHVVDVDLSEFRDAHREVNARMDEWLDLTGKPSTDSMWEYARDSLTLVSKLRVAAGLCKIPAAIDFLTQWVQAHPEEDSIIVWAHHRAVVDALYQAAIVAVGKDKVSVIKGGTGAQTMGKIAQDFQEGKIKVLVASITAAGVGITLTRSQTALMVETDWTPANVIQAEDRQARFGQTRKVSITTLIAPGTLDETIQRTLVEKSRSLDATLDGEHNVSVAPDMAAPASVIVFDMLASRVEKKFATTVGRG